MSKNHAALHAHGSADWMTPPAYIEAARKVMGGIDLDPASDEEASLIVKAPMYYTAWSDGLAVHNQWKGRIFLNPPGGLVREFWARLVHEYARKRGVDQAVWIGYSLEQLQTLQRAFVLATPLDFMFCVPDRRIAFVENKAKHAERVEKLLAAGKNPSAASSPSHGNYVCYLGRRRRRFVKVFSAFGTVVNERV